MTHRYLPSLIATAFAACTLLFDAASPGVAASAKGLVEAEEPRSAARPGPWGLLETSPIHLEAPDYLLASVPKPNSVPRWCFATTDAAALRALFARANLPADMQQRLFDPQRTLVQDGVTTLFPTVADLVSLTPEMRAVVYPELAKVPLNEFHRDPIFIPGGNIDEWLRDTKLSPTIQALFRKMTYRRGRALAFSDLRTLLNHARSDAEVQHVFKTATRTRTFMAYLKIPAEGDIEEIVRYWAAGRADSDMIPLLRSLHERPFGATLDITHLLPAHPRRRLYTYPTPDLATRGRMPDCHWTSLNFFSRTSQDYYLDTRLASNHVVENYQIIQPPYRLGDVLFFNNAAGETIHSCVFVADDIVYTKNGENALSPWILMRLGDVQDIYLPSPECSMRGYRQKPAALP